MWRFSDISKTRAANHNSHCFAVRSVLLPCMLFCREICSFEIYAVLLQSLFCCDLRTFCVETIYAQYFVRGEKITNIMYMTRSPKHKFLIDVQSNKVFRCVRSEQVSCTGWLNQIFMLRLCHSSTISLHLFLAAWNHHQQFPAIQIKVANLGRLRYASAWQGYRGKKA